MASVAARSSLGREARPCGRLGAALLEADPLRRQERQDRDGQDDDRGRERDEQGGGAAGDGVHGPILARRGSDAYSSSSVFAWSHQPSRVRSVGGSIPSSPAPRRTRALKRRQVEFEDVVETLDPGLDHELVLVRPEAGQVEHQRLVPPHQHVGRVRGDLIGQRLASGRRLRPLQEKARREDP